MVPNLSGSAIKTTKDLCGLRSTAINGSTSFGQKPLGKKAFGQKTFGLKAFGPKA